jgi:hypothetical protein
MEVMEIMMKQNQVPPLPLYISDQSSVHGPIAALRAQPKKGDTVRISPSCTPVGSEQTPATGT